MNWKSSIIVAALLLVFLLLKRVGLIPVREARELLEEGAIVIDVRTEHEFAGGHLPRAINIPLDQIEIMAPQQIKDMNQVLLLYCHSGISSAAAARRLKRMGYTSALILGSLARATRITHA